MCSVVTPGGQLLVSARADSGLYKLGTCGLELLREDIWPNGAWPNTCGPHADGALFCAGKNCYLYNETTGEMGNIQYQKDYHYGGAMGYIDGKGAVAIGGSSVDTPGGRIELYYEREGDGREKWHNLIEAGPTDWDPDRVQLPVEYKFFTVTKEPHCDYTPWCSGLMLFGGYGCEAEDTNCAFYQESYITSIDTAFCDSSGCTLEAVTHKNTKIDRLIQWEMPNVHGYKTIDSVLDRDSGFLVHAQTFNCKGFGSNEFIFVYFYAMLENLKNTINMYMNPKKMKITPNTMVLHIKWQIRPVMI